MSTDESSTSYLLAKFKKLGKRNKPLYQKAFQFMNVLS